MSKELKLDNHSIVKLYDVGRNVAKKEIKSKHSFKPLKLIDMDSVPCDTSIYEKCCCNCTNGGGNSCPICIPIASEWSEYLFWDTNNATWSIGGGSIDNYRVHLGTDAGLINQGSNAIAFGFESGYDNQKDHSIAIGTQAGYTGQDFYSVAIGFQAGQCNQKQNSVAIGIQTGTINQQNNSVAIGSYSGHSNQQATSVAIGVWAGYETQGGNCIALGNTSGYSNQGASSIAIGLLSGAYNQKQSSIAIGTTSGICNQGTYSIAIGYEAGSNNQGNGGGIENSSIAIGYQAGKATQAFDSIAIGTQAGKIEQKSNSIAIGCNAGSNNQSINSIAIGCAGQDLQGSQAIAIGYTAGVNSQGENAIAVGHGAGQNLQGSQAIAIGYASGVFSQGENSIALGFGAGNNLQSSNSIIINATNALLDNVDIGSGTCKICPIRGNITTANVLYYNNSNFEITYGAKTFVINHPTDSNKYLQHACLEGPEAGVYYRGEAQIKNKYAEITLPDYVDKISTEFTVQITPIVDDDYKEDSLDIKLYTTRIKNGKFKVFGNINEISFYWTVFGKRHGLIIEPSKFEYELKGDGPYTYLTKK